MSTTATPLGRELNDAELDAIHGAAACTVVIVRDGSGRIVNVTPIGDCDVKEIQLK